MMTVFTINQHSGRRVYYHPAFPVKDLVGVFKGPRDVVFAKLIDSITRDGVLNPIWAGTNISQIIPRTGKQRVEVCKILGITEVPVVVVDTGKMIPKSKLEWTEILTQEQGEALFADNYNFTLDPPELTKDLEEYYT
jgi:hypothetical protein